MKPGDHVMSTEMRSANVSVTPINMEYVPPTGQLTNGTATVINTTGGVVKSVGVTEPPRTRSAPHPLVPVTDVDNTDLELARIEFQSVNMRSKKEKKDEVPRPMSWEGELSDGEREGMFLHLKKIIINLIVCCYMLRHVH